MFSAVNNIFMTVETNSNNIKSIRYLRVVADMKPNSPIMPLKVIYDEKEYIVDEIFNVKRFVVEQIGELCNAYYCKFKHKIRILYLDKNYNWFVI